VIVMFAPVGFARPAGIGLPAAAAACASPIQLGLPRSVARRSSAAAAELRGLATARLDT
jgi:hypothetical protein